MQKRLYRVKTLLYTINGVANIPAPVLVSGHGYGSHSFCCKSCGEIFVIEDESLSTNTLTEITLGKKCPKCKADLNATLVPYPKFMPVGGRVIENRSQVAYAPSEETQWKEFFHLVK